MNPTYRHDGVPTHPMRPEYLIRADQARAAAWRLHDALSEGVACGAPDWAAIDTILGVIETAQAGYNAAYDRWMRECAPVECTCSLPERVCQVCAQAASDDGDGPPY